MIRLAQRPRADAGRVVDRVEDCILRSLPFADLATVDENRELLRPKPQEYFGIEAANVSPSSWQAAVEELNKVNNQRMPSGKLRALLRCRTKIYDLFSAERAAATATADGAQAKEAYLAADDFLSVFVFVLVQSELSQLPAVCRFMSELCDPDLLAGQHGYYLTVFESAIRCIHDADPAAEMLAAAVMDAPSRQSSLSGHSLSAPSPHRLSSAGAAAEREQAGGEEGEEGGGEGDPRPDSPLSTGDAAELPMPPAPRVAGGAASALDGGDA